MKKYFTAAIIFAAAFNLAFAGGSVFGGDTFNTTNNTTNNNPVANGGQGGNGGTGIGFGGNADSKSSAYSAASQGQQQGQFQGQGQSLYNSNKASSYNAGVSNTTSVSVAGDKIEYKQAASTAYAPTVLPTAVCMGSTSLGGTGLSFGFSFGSSWTDKNCMLLEQVRTTSSVLGDKETAALMMCQVEAYRTAREQAGRPCPSAPEPK